MPFQNPTQVDFSVENYGSVWLVHPQNAAATATLAEAIEPDAVWFGNALAVEARFIGGLVSSLREDGWRIR